MSLFKSICSEQNNCFSYDQSLGFFKHLSWPLQNNTDQVIFMTLLY